MKKSLLCLALPALLLTLSSCGTEPLVQGPLVAHQLPFREADFAFAARPGAASVSGRIGITFNDGSMQHGRNIYVDLMPVTPYTTEIVNRKFIHHENVAPTGPKLDKYIRSTVTDSEGNFAFHNVPAGEYYVDGVVDWKDEEDYIDNESHLTEHAVSWWTNHKWAWERIKVGSGQSLHVNVTQ